jgi:NADH-quinone oxidoreductase subunit B
MTGTESLLGNEATTTTVEAAEGFFRRLLDKGPVQDVVNWGRKWSFFQYPFVTACCGMEYMATAGPRYDYSRFGAELPRFSPRQADLLMVVGTISHKQAPILRTIYEQMAEPKWVISFGVCASSGGFYRNYATVQGIDTIIPVDVYIPGCPPRPEAVIDALMMLQDKVQKERGSLLPVVEEAER